MKHRFLLDENIVYFAVKGVDKQDSADLTCAELVRLIGEHCHTAVADRTLLSRYHHHITELYAKPQFLVQATNLVLRIVENSAKLSVERADPPELPEGVRIPHEDVHVVRAALISHPIVVTDDGDLVKAIRRHQDALHLLVRTPREALELAMDS